MSDHDEKDRLERQRLEINRDRASASGDHSRAFDIQQRINKLPKAQSSGQQPPSIPPVATISPAGDDDDRIGRLERELADLKGWITGFKSSLIPRHDPLPSIFPARSTSDGPTCWQEQTTQEDGTLGDYTDGRQSATDGDDSNYIDGAELFLCEFPNIDKYRYALISAGFRIVSLSMDGGSDGTASTANSYTYTGTAIGGGTSIFTAQTSALQRANGHRVPATRGIWNSKNSELYPLDEIEGTDACPGGG